MANDKRLLEQHGTQLSILKPSSIWAAAQEDLKRRDHNRHDSGAPDKMLHYAFHRSHVKKAQTPNDIIRAALADPAIGLQSHKFNTRLIYSDLALLEAALQ